MSQAKALPGWIAAIDDAIATIKTSEAVVDCLWSVAEPRCTLVDALATTANAMRESLGLPLVCYGFGCGECPHCGAEADHA